MRRPSFLCGVRNAHLHYTLAHIVGTDTSPVCKALFYCFSKLFNSHAISFQDVVWTFRCFYSGDWSCRKGLTGTAGASGNYPYDGLWHYTVRDTGGGGDAPTVLERKVAWLSVFNILQIFLNHREEEVIESAKGQPPGSYLVWTNGQFSSFPFWTSKIRRTAPQSSPACHSPPWTVLTKSATCKGALRG